eukprot:CAMPEP_0182419822 /NCGR_PEP_ID=MMETSP1167-20130531/4182_1 /TAXON_ID=2988 /ORGANISM="Mallomonas Sp, Strain CCMP3275" /LENGTH=451 /DNA_ID=CAMNT_0024594931 /DNA_START=479 /DNA_END=1833 /DNA_ORIENTATION=-
MAGVCGPKKGPGTSELGADKFENGPLLRFGGPQAVSEFRSLRAACSPLAEASARISTLSLRGEAPPSLFPLLPLLLTPRALKGILPYTNELKSSFQSLMTEHVSNQWLRDWLDALAFSISGLPASETEAAALAFTLHDMHKTGACLDYPQGGMGRIADVLTEVLTASGGTLHLSSPVASIEIENGRAAGVRLKNGQRVRAKKAVVCNANIWALQSLLRSEEEKLSPEQHLALICGSRDKRMTKSFLHLHLGLDGTGLINTNTAHRSALQPHYTVMAKGLSNGADPCADRNMVAVSVPSVLDSSLTDRENGLIVHAYGAGNEPYEWWQDLSRGSKEYEEKKALAAEYLYESVGRALDLTVEEVRERSDVALIGSPLTHERFLRRERGTYGAAWGSMREGPGTALPGLLLCGDSVFPGIGVPAVALSGANAANTLSNVLTHMVELIKRKDVML